MNKPTTTIEDVMNRIENKLHKFGDYSSGSYYLRESIANQINFWCTYCTWRHNPLTYYVAHERVNVELSEYAAYNPYC